MTEHLLERDGVRLHYETHGSDHGSLPLLLSHGYSAEAGMWEHNLAALSSHRRVVTWDIRGHGRTVTPSSLAHYTQDACVKDMAGILDACGIRRVAVGGLSLGGYLSLAFHSAHRERVGALLLFDTGPGFKNETARARWNAYAVSQAERFERDALAALPDSPEAKMGTHDATGLALAARGILTQSDSTILDSLPAIKVPTLIVVGERDTGFLAAADYMASHIPRSVLHIIPDAGHAANIDQPARFDQVIVEFLDGLETEASDARVET